MISEGIILELAGKLATPRIARRYGVRASHVRSTASLLRTVGSLVTVLEDEVAPVTGDPEDDLVLATAHLGGASDLVTGDRALLDLGSHERVSIVSPRAFLGVLQEAAPDDVAPAR